MIEATLYARIAAVEANTFPLRAPENVAFPCVIYTRISTVPTRDLTAADGTADFLFQVDCYALDYLSAKELADTIRNQLCDWSTTGIQACDFLTESDMIDETTPTSLYHIMQEYRLFAALD